jgi:hypothetical protein
MFNWKPKLTCIKIFLFLATGSIILKPCFSTKMTQTKAVMDPLADIESDPEFADRFVRVQNTVREAVIMVGSITPQQKMQLSLRDIRATEIQLGALQQQGDLTVEETAMQRALQQRLLVLYIARQRIELLLCEERNARLSSMLSVVEASVPVC